MAVHNSEMTIPRPPFLGGGNWEVKGLTDVSIIFARTGAGKSKLLQKILEEKENSRHLVSPERGGSIDADPNEAQNQSDPKHRASSRKQNSAPNLRREAVSRIQTYLLARGSQRTEHTVGATIDEIEGLLAILLPGFCFSISGRSRPPYTLKRGSDVPQQSSVQNVAEMSSGEAELFTIGLDVATVCAIWEMDGQDKGMLLFDEPDVHLHPESQNRLADFIVRLVNRFKVQVIITTHSTTLLAAISGYGRDRVSFLPLDPNSATMTCKPLDKYYKDLSFCLGGHAMMGTLSGAPLLLVEGEDDEQIWMRAGRGENAARFFCLPSVGKGEIPKYEKALEQIYSAVCDTQDSTPKAYSLRDIDGPDQKSDQSGRKFVRSLWLKCYAAENLYLSDEVLGKMNIADWQTAQGYIRDAAAKYTAAQKSVLEQVAAYTAEQRKTFNLPEEAMQPLVEILDPRTKLDWRLRVGQVLASKKPSGNLAEFLGEDVISALWPT